MSHAHKPTVQILPSTEGTPFYEVEPSKADVLTLTTPGTPQTLMTYTVPSGKKFRLLKVKVNCRVNSYYNVYENSSLIASGILGAGNPDEPFVWVPYRELAAGDVFKIEFLQGTGPAIDVYAHTHAALIDV